ncbi:DegT/DnrJ/EryC1/StrS family aminotransferase [Pseudonocardia nematodicida]|uniref:DegT/DnrJ/EryC1/StrS family aminotransferase n=1 Tax=Pseudonocardia nematodicida TaxID=1206997 RepID=A0ABV1K3T5_9PSEU
MNATVPGTVTVPFLDLAADNAVLRDDLDLAWKSVTGHGRFVGGPEVAAFETAFAGFCGTRHALGVGNGTDALEIILRSLGIGRGDEVIVPANSFVATVEAVCTAGARPRFVDVLPDTLLLDPDQVAAAVGPRTAAVIAVHLFGQMADMPALEAITRAHGLALVEDAAQAHGAEFAGRRAGSVGVAAAFSFYPGKNLGALGDGGAVVTDDTGLAARMRCLADHGRSDTDRHRHPLRGVNSRLDTLQAAILLAKLPALDAATAHRRAAMTLYRDLLPACCTPVVQRPEAASVHHLAVVQVDDRAAVTARLDAHGVGWGVHYPVPCHRQPAFAEFADGPLPVTEAAAGRILSLPMYATIAAETVGIVCAVLAGGGAVLSGARP